MYKITPFIQTLLFVSLFFSNGFSGASAQDLVVIKKKKAYEKDWKSDFNHQMVELKSLDPTFIYDLAYASTNNFTRQRLYNQVKYTFLRMPTAQALLKVQKHLLPLGYGLKIYDAYRPYSVTKKMWDLIQDERYVANPAKGSGHNRGLSVDLTIVDLKTSMELDMGTGFDNFTDTAHHDFKDLPSKVLENRLLLKQVMEQHGFRALSTEWWHYSWPNDRNYNLLDLDFKKLRN
jgi:D-alanyl-D-alanine dipeptidase